MFHAFEFGAGAAALLQNPQVRKWRQKIEIEKKKTIGDKIAELAAKRAELELGGGKERIERQHASGKLTARERVERLVDRGSFEEIGLFSRHRATYFGMAEKELPADGVVTGCATHRRAAGAPGEPGFYGGGRSRGRDALQQSGRDDGHEPEDGQPVRVYQRLGRRARAGRDRQPGGIRAGVLHNVMLSGTVPQISLICGPCAGGAAYSPALTDFVIQTEQARMFITGPQVIKQVTGEEVSAEELGGPQSQMHYSGVVHLIARDDE